MARRYSLEPLVGVRRREVEGRTAELGKAAAGRQKEQAAVALAKARTAEARRVAKVTREAERAELERGVLTARDLVQGELHRAGVASKLSELARGEAAAAEKLSRAKASEAKAKVLLGRARAEEDAVVRHRGRFHAELAKKQEKEQEDAAAEVFTAARRGARRG
jgi:chromosome segregation protein